MKKFVLILAVLFYVVQGGMFALENHTTLSLIGSTIPEGQLSVNESLVFPCLQKKDNPLMTGNNVTLNFGADVSPVHVLASTSVVWTPIAFFNLTGGAKIGMGWNYNLFGSDVSGLGLYDYNTDDFPHEHAAGKGADGVYWTGFAGATLQFDVAALWSGKWHHIVGQVYNEVSYQQYTKAHTSDIWYWTNNVRPNENSFLYYFDAVLGYKMPIILDMVGVMFGIMQPLYNPQSGESVGKLGPEMTASIMLDFKFLKSLNLTVMTQFMNKPKSPLTERFAREWGFYRVTAIITWGIK
jgi:hypothetical protein